MAPTISIIMPTFNREMYLERTLDSVLAQSHKSFELIIADDGSTDRSVEIAKRYAIDDGRIRVICLPHKGEVAARNAAFAATDPTSLYILNHDSDDISLPDKLEKLGEFLAKNSEIAIVGCQAEYIDEKDQKIKDLVLETDPGRIRATFHQVNWMINSASLIRRKVFEEMGGYREAYRSVDDYDFFARTLMAGYQLANLPEVLHQIRLHPTSITSTRRRLTRLLVARIRADYQYFLTTQNVPWQHKLLPQAMKSRVRILAWVEYRTKSHH